MGMHPLNKRLSQQGKGTKENPKDQDTAEKSVVQYVAPLSSLSKNNVLLIVPLSCSFGFIMPSPLPTSLCTEFPFLFLL